MYVVLQTTGKGCKREKVKGLKQRGELVSVKRGRGRKWRTVQVSLSGGEKDGVL